MARWIVLLSMDISIIVIPRLHLSPNTYTFDVQEAPRMLCRQDAGTVHQFPLPDYGEANRSGIGVQFRHLLYSSAFV